MRVSATFITLALAVGAMAAPLVEERKFDLAKVCGQDSQGNKVCADSKSVTIFSSGRCSKNSHVEPPCIESYKRNVDVRLLKVCGQDSKGNKVCAEKREVEIDARLLKVCGKDAKGNVVCAEKRQELDARSILPSKVCGKDSKGNVVCADSQKRDLEARLRVCGWDTHGNSVCAGKREELLARGISPETIKCKVSIYTGVICKDDKNDNKREVDVEARLLKVCGQDSKGNKVCAEKREVELEARLLKVCGQDAHGNKVCAEKREELAARGITPNIVCGWDTKGDKVCADSKSVILPSKVCGQDSKGDKVCAEKREDVATRSLSLENLCIKDAKGNVICPNQQ